MKDETRIDALLTSLSSEDARSLGEAFSSLGRASQVGDPVNDLSPALVFSGAYDESSLRAARAAAMEDSRPWCFCVPVGDRAVVAAAAQAREGRLLLLPPEQRELRRILASLAEDAKERSSGRAAFSGIERLEASFAWKTRDIDVSRVCRRLARILFESGFYLDRADEDECALALEEALVNSVEHGNLGLDSSLRPDDPTAEDRYEAERERRLADPGYGDRLVRVDLAIFEDEARISIEDEGEGFDTSGIVEEPSGLDVSGKGFWLIKKPFDGAEYDSRGSRLTLTRRRPPSP